MELMELFMHPTVKEIIGNGIISNENHSLRIEYQSHVPQQGGEAVCKIGNIHACVGVFLLGGKEQVAQIYRFRRRRQHRGMRRCPADPAASPFHRRRYRGSGT